MSQMKTDDELDVMKTVFKLRSQRPKLVQTFEQYALLYQVITSLELSISEIIFLSVRFAACKIWYFVFKAY